MKSKIQLIALSVFLSLTSHAATVVSYTAIASPSANPDGNDGTNNVNVWTTSTIGANAGFFQGTGNIGPNSWGTFANSDSESFATHSFLGGNLGIGQTVSLNFENGSIASGKSTGIQLRNGTTLVFAFYFRGGQSVYEYFSNGVFDQDTTEGFSADGGTFSFTLGNSNSFSASYRSASWNGTVSGTPIDNILVYNNSAGAGSGADVFFNNLSVIPEPTTSALVVGAMALTMVLRRRRSA